MVSILREMYYNYVTAWPKVIYLMYYCTLIGTVEMRSGGPAERNLKIAQG